MKHFAAAKDQSTCLPAQKTQDTTPWIFLDISKQTHIVGILFLMPLNSDLKEVTHL